MTVKPHIRSISEGLHVWTPQPSAGWGLANCGLVAPSSRPTAAWIDSPYDHALASSFYAEGRALLSEGAEIDWLLVTHGNGDHLWGASAVPRAKVIYTAETADHIAHEPDPAQLHHLVHESDPNSVVGWYMRKHFGRYRWETTKLPEPTITFSGELEIAVGDIPVQLTQLAPAHTVGDLIAYLPLQKTCFSGDVIFAATPHQPGDHPVHWAGPIAGIIEGCERVLATGAEIIVPGHGPILDRAGVNEHVRYLEYLRGRSHKLYADGVELIDAARQIIAEDVYPDLHLRERIVITVGTEYQHLSGAQPTPMVELISRLAHLAWSLERPHIPVPRGTSESARSHAPR